MIRCYKVKSFGAKTIKNKYTNYIHLDNGMDIPIKDNKVYNNIHFETLVAIKKEGDKYEILKLFRKNFNTNEYERFNEFEVTL